VILAIDTTSEYGSLALCDRDRVIEEVSIHSPDGFAHVVFQELLDLLARNSVRIAEIDRYAAASGPGSFTGVRIGLALAKGLAFATGKKVVAVSVLQAVASLGSAPLRAAVIDARRGEVYAALYDAALHLVVAEVATTLDKFRAMLPNESIEFISMDPPRPLAAAIGTIATSREGEMPEAIDANYVRRSDAERAE
jgi:tRNA threonylcarbamoyladenosine biosynthesis protein TsaB